MDNGNTNIVRRKNQESTYVAKTEVKQTCILSPLLFNIVLDETIKRLRI